MRRNGAGCNTFTKQILNIAISTNFIGCNTFAKQYPDGAVNLHFTEKKDPS